jgi:hypothetical protein
MAKFRITKTDQIASDIKVLNVSKLCLFSIIREAKKNKNITESYLVFLCRMRFNRSL